MKTSSKFRKFCGNLAIDYQNKKSKRLKSITKRLNKDFWGHNSDTHHSFYAGSHGRHTAIKGSSDIDIIFHLPYKIHSRYNSHSGNGQSALLQAIKNSINTPYWQTYMKGDGQVVVTKFADKMKFEIVPAFLQKDGQYIYPDSNAGGQWKYMNPKLEIQEFLRADKEIANGNLKRLCRMMRAWKLKWNVKIQGILIDTLAYKFIKKWRYRKKDYSYYAQMSCDFFKYLANQKKGQKYWLIPGSSQRIYRQGNFEYRANQCHRLTIKAIKQEEKSNNYSANKIWRKIFGQQFPT